MKLLGIGSAVAFCGHQFRVAKLTSKATKNKIGDRVINCDVTLTGVRTLVMGHLELEGKISDGSIVIQ